MRSAESSVLAMKPSVGLAVDPPAELSLVIRRDEDDGGRFAVRAVHQAVGNVEAALLAEADVDERQVGTKCLREPDRLVARSCNADDRDPFVLEQGPRFLAEARAIVDDQAAQRHDSYSIAAQPDWLARGLTPKPPCGSR